MTVPSAFNISWVEYEQFAQQDWDRCELGEVFRQRIDEDGHYWLAFLHYAGVFVIENPQWDGRADRVKYEAALDALKKQLNCARCFFGGHPVIACRVQLHDEVFRLNVKEHTFMDGCYYRKDDTGVQFFTIEGDLAHQLTLSYN